MKKSNEITAIPQLSRLLDISGYIITIDAMGTQKKIAKTITEKDGDYILAVKENHKTLCNDSAWWNIFVKSMGNPAKRDDITFQVLPVMQKLSEMP